MNEKFYFTYYVLRPQKAKVKFLLLYEKRKLEQQVRRFDSFLAPF